MWNQRYNTEHYIYGTEPNSFLAQHVRELPLGPVLCLAEGEGRNAVFLAEQGYEVTAVDASAVGLAKARNLASARSVNIHTVQADLAEFDLGTGHWAGIVSIFCHLPPAIRQIVHARLDTALIPGGVLILEAYTEQQLQLKTGGPSDPAMMMSIQKLQQEITGLHFNCLQEVEREIIEGTGHTGRGAVVQAIAVKVLD
ncbi:MAG: class I SAM-dependent methyltransferase [Pseudohongiella sp.]|nr:class I SAM-dependent methyltransferase [Pseudohongiella sp.]